MSLNQIHFDTWEPSTGEELEQLCHTLPVLPREKASVFFEEAKQVTTNFRGPNEIESGNIFHSLISTILASDPQDFDVTWEFNSWSIANGMLMIETHDPVIPELFCVARISEDSFFTGSATFDGIPPAKNLQNQPSRV